MQHLLTKLAAAAIVVGAAIGSGEARAGPLPALGELANQTSQSTPVEKAGRYGYRYGYYPFGYRYWRPYPYGYYRPYYGYRYSKPYRWRYGYRRRPDYRYW